MLNFPASVFSMEKNLHCIGKDFVRHKHYGNTQMKSYIRKAKQARKVFSCTCQWDLIAGTIIPCDCMAKNILNSS